MRTYLVVIDDSDESQAARNVLRRARAARTGGHRAYRRRARIPPSDFVAWGGAQATIEEEARQHGEAVAQAAANAIYEGAGIRPSVTVKQGDAASIVREILAEDREIAALVLGAAASGPPGPLVSHFTGDGAGSLPVPVMIVPGSLSEDELDRLS
jgi:nucleotide-binding universal stress UspA family protein